MTSPGQPQTCSHLINVRMLTGVCQVSQPPVWQFQLSLYVHDPKHYKIISSNVCTKLWPNSAETLL